MDDETRALVDRVGRSIGGWYSQLMDKVKPGRKLHDRFFTYELDTSDVQTDDLGKALNIFISGRHEDQNYRFNHIILTGFFVWVQKEVFDFTNNLWEAFSKKLGCFSAASNCFAGTAEMHDAFSGQTTGFSETILKWAQEHFIEGQTKESCYKRPRGVIKKPRWRVAMVISECGVTEENDDFFRDYFGLGFDEFRSLEPTEGGDRFIRLYKALDQEGKGIVAHKWDWAVHAFRLIQLVSARASSLGYNIDRYPAGDIDEVLKVCVEEDLFSSATRRRLDGVLRLVRWENPHAGDAPKGDLPGENDRLKFQVYPGLSPNGQGAFRPMLSLKCRDDEEEGQVSILDENGRKFVAMHEPESTSPFCAMDGDSLLTSASLFGDPAPSFEECVFTPLHNTETRSRPARLVFPGGRVYFLAKGPHGRLCGVPSARSALASHILLPRVLLREVTDVLARSGVTLREVPGDILPDMPSFALRAYSEPVGGLENEIVLPGGATIGGGASPQLMRFARGLRVRGGENRWFPFDPPVALVLKEDHEPFSRQIQFELVGEEDGYRVWELSPREGEDFPAEATVSLKDLSTGQKVADDRIIRFEIELQAAALANGSLDQFGEWRQNQGGWFGLGARTGPAPHGHFDMDQMPPALARSYQGEKVEQIDAFPEVWDNIATALRGMGGGFIQYRRFCRLLNQYLGDAEMGKTRAEYEIIRDYNAMGMIEVETRADGVPNKMLPVPPTAYLSPWKPNYRFCAVLGGSFTRREVQALAAAARADHKVDLYFRPASSGYKTKAYPPTVSMTCASLDHLADFLAGCGINFTRIPPAESLGRFLRGLPLVSERAFREKSLGGTYVRPTGIKCIAFEPQRLLPGTHLDPEPGEFKVGLVEKGLYGKFDKYYLCYKSDGEILYKEWRDPRMAKWIGAPKTQMIRWFPNHQVVADLRLPLLAERALGLCWDKAPYRRPWRGRDRWIYYPVPERIAKQVASNLLGEDRFMIMKPADWNT